MLFLPKWLKVWRMVHSQFLLGELSTSPAELLPTVTGCHNAAHAGISILIEWLIGMSRMTSYRLDCGAT